MRSLKMNRMRSSELYGGVGRTGRYTSVIVGFTYLVDVYETVPWFNVAVDTRVLVVVF